MIGGERAGGWPAERPRASCSEWAGYYTPPLEFGHFEYVRIFLLTYLHHLWYPAAREDTQGGYPYGKGRDSGNNLADNG